MNYSTDPPVDTIVVHDAASPLVDTVLLVNFTTVLRMNTPMNDIIIPR